MKKVYLSAPGLFTSLRRLLGIAGPLFAWEIISLIVGQRWLPPPWETSLEFINSFKHNRLIAAQGLLSPGVAYHALATCYIFLMGGAWGAIFAAFTSFFCASFRSFGYLTVALIAPWRIIPPLLLVPFSLLISGVSERALIGTTALFTYVSFAPYAIYFLTTTPAAYLDLAEVSGKGRLWTLVHVRIAYAIPDLIGPLKAVSAFSLGIVIILQYMAAPDGLGRIMKIALSYTDVLLLIVCVLWTVLIGAAADFLIELAFHRNVAWARRRQ